MYSKHETQKELGVLASMQKITERGNLGASDRQKIYGSVPGNQDQYNPQAKERRTALQIKLGIGIILEEQKWATTCVRKQPQGSAAEAARVTTSRALATHHVGEFAVVLWW